jgi:tetratricopeptide (TPR) repeat protein
MADMVNPYIAGAPVTEAKMFFGREDVFDWIQNSLTGRYADHILVIHGQRRVGKTSVLKQLGNRLPEKYIPIFFDLQGRTHTTLDRFLWWLAREIVRVLKQERDITVPVPEKEPFAADPEYFENHFLPGLRPVLGEHSLLLTFDEFDNLEEREIKEEFARPLIDYLRRMMGQEGLNFIFSIGSSGRKLENMQAAYTEFFKTALYKKISFLSKEQTFGLVTRPVEGVLEYEREAVDKIYIIASGHPYFTQLTCHELFSLCQRTGELRIREVDVESILNDVVERGTVNLKFTWDEASDIEKWSLAALAQLDKTDTRALADYLRKQRVRFSESDLTSGLLHLREKEVLTPENRFVIHLLKLWLQKNRPIEQARDELTEVNPIANRFIEIGLEFRDSKQYEKAIENFLQALAVSSDNTQAQVNIALTYAAQGMLDQAVIEFEKALILDDEDVASRAGLCEAHLTLGDSAMSKGRIQDAVQSYQRVLGINAEHTEARQRMADINLQRAKKALTDGRDEEALSALLQALKYTPEDPALNEQLEKFKVEKKAKVLASLVARSEREARALNWEGVVNTLEEAIHLLPEDSNAQKKLVEAREKLREKKLVALRARAQGLADAEKFNDALKTWQEYLSLKPDDHQKVEEEITHLKKEQELLDTYNNAGQAITNRNFDKAISLLKEVIIRDENYKDASRLLTKAIELRRTAPKWWQSKSTKESVRFQKPKSRSGIKTGVKRIWLVGILLAILFLGVGGALLWSGENNLPAISSLFANNTATPTITATPTTTATPAITATITPTRTPRPTPTTTPTMQAFELSIRTYMTGHAPTFEDDFSTPDMVWGSNSEGFLIYAWVKDGVLTIRDNVEIGEGMKPDYHVPGVTFPTNGLLNASNFALQFDFVFETKIPVDIVAVKFRSYEIRFVSPGDWYLYEIGNTQKPPITGGHNSLKPLENTLLIIAYNENLAIYLNGTLFYATNEIALSGSKNTITLTGADFTMDFDNFKFWDLEGVDFNP